MFQKALVPLDGSALAERILPYVSQMAAGFNTRLVLFSAIDTDAVDLPRRFGNREAREAQTAEIVESMESNLRDRLNVLAGNLAAHNIEATTLVSRGKPADEILSGAQEEGCDLIAMSTHGRNVMGQGVLGSVTDKVVHSSNVPTLTILPESAQEYDGDSSPISKLIVPLDGSELAEAALPYVEQLAKGLSLEIILVRAVNMSSMMMNDLGTTYVGYEDVEESLASEASEYLEEVAARIRANELTVDIKILRGSPGQTIGEFSDQTPGSLIALASRGRSGVSRWMLGSVAESLVRVSGDPVLILPSGSS